MKRFLLVTLMCSILVGQTSCEWSWGNFAKGVASATVGSLAFPFLQDVGSPFSKNKNDQNRFQENFRFNIGESASAYIGSSLAGLAAIKYLNNANAAKQFCGYDNASGFAGVLSASALLWAGTHGRSLINSLSGYSSGFSMHKLFSSWSLNDFIKGASEATKETFRGVIATSIVSKITGSKSGFRENMGYGIGSSSCNLIRRSATGIGALAFGQSGIARKRYGSNSGAYFAGGIAASSVLSFFVACAVMGNYYINPIQKSAQIAPRLDQVL